MRRVLFCVLPEQGHLNPCIGPAQRLQAHGLEVAFHGAQSLGAQLRRAGPFLQLGAAAVPRHDALRRGAQFAASVRDAAWLRRWIRELLIDRVADEVPALRAAIRHWRPDVIVIDPLCYAAAIAAEREGHRWVALSNSLNPVLPDALDSELLATVRELLPARRALFERFGVAAHFRGCDVLSPYLTMVFATEALVGPPPVGVTLLGPSLPATIRGDESEFPWARLDAALPLVYLSFGSQIYHQPELFAKVTAALRDLPLQLVLSAGELADSLTRTALDARTVIVRYAPQLALLRRARLFITHGGANSVMEALACGVPLLISPLCNDQFHQAYFIERAGVGRRLDLREASCQDIAAAVGSLLSVGAHRERLEAIRASYRRDGADEAARLISALAAESRPGRAS